MQVLLSRFLRVGVFQQNLLVVDLSPEISTEKGFDFLGYRFGRIELTVARVTLKRFLGRVSRLSEQEQGTSSDDAGSVLGAYVRRWLGWLTGGAPRGLVSGCEREPESLHSACRVCRQSCYGTGGPLKIIVAR